MRRYVIHYLAVPVWAGALQAVLFSYLITGLGDQSLGPLSWVVEVAAAGSPWVAGEGWQVLPAGFFAATVLVLLGGIGAAPGSNPDHQRAVRRWGAMALPALLTLPWVAGVVAGLPESFAASPESLSPAASQARSAVIVSLAAGGAAVATWWGWRRNLGEALQDTPASPPSAADRRLMGLAAVLAVLGALAFVVG